MSHSVPPHNSASPAASRMAAISLANSRQPRAFNRPMSHDGTPRRSSEYFGSNVFSFELMEKKLPARDVAQLKEFATNNQALSADLADKVAVAVKDWALQRGVTHYCHWFQPQTGTTAEKHDSFFAFDKHGNPIETFTGKQLIQSEPDASSFPSGGRRSTFEARGYTAWDASSPMFLMESENGLTLCIPSLFISYSGEALDKKTPLLRSIAAISRVSVESLKLLGYDAKYVVATAGPEQEYFVLDEGLFGLRPDLVLAGRTLFGRRPPKGQQLEDHYFGSIRPRILSYMMECEQELYKLGVPIKTRHNEVAPSQCEAAPIFEFANVAADHNQLTMEVFRSVAARHNLRVLFHEKPYAEINGSGKHVNWSLADSAGHNLLEPGERPHENLRFLYFLSAVIKAVHDHGPVLRMSIASAGNDFRLGANEAPPAIMSVFLGEQLSELIERIETNSDKTPSARAQSINLELARVPVIVKDNTDRNRTSPFAFTGNKFEFRAVGASASVSPPLTFLNTAVAESLAKMNEKLRALSSGGKASDEQVFSVIQETIKASRKICFEGNNYDSAWHKEAESRGIPNLRTTPEALAVLKDPKVQDMLSRHGVLTKDESAARYNVRVERYVKVRRIELETLLELVTTHITPSLLRHVELVGNSLKTMKEVGGTKVPDALHKTFETATTCLDKLLHARESLAQYLRESWQMHDEEKLAQSLAGRGMELLDSTRKIIEDAEGIIDDTLWTLPKYREILYLM